MTSRKPHPAVRALRNAGAIASRIPVRRALRSRLTEPIDGLVFGSSRAARALFDSAFYVDRYPDVLTSKLSPLGHYARYGGAEDRDPNAVFDSAYYRLRYMGSSTLTPLVHFILHGRYQRHSPSPFFDYETYLRLNADVAAAPVEPYEHFVSYGLREGRHSSLLFSPERYLQANPDVQGYPWGALGHYARYGESEGRGPFYYADQNGATSSQPESGEPWEQLILEQALPDSQHRAKVDVIVPVYRGYDETLSSLYHVIASRSNLPHELVVVADCPPEPELTACLERLAAKGYFTLHINRENLGFVKSVNLGMRLHEDRDVILLNSDTEVYHDWIDRLHLAAYQSDLISTVTPLTNNGTICGYPHSPQDNPEPLEISYRELDIAASRSNGIRPLPAPTAVGFCMYIKRDVLNRVGYFDEEAFGLGYGEENDFCLRAQKLGYLDTIATNVFVRHLGSTSFQGTRVERVQNALRVIDSRYPNYQRTVRQFVQSDPLRPARARLDAARLTALSADRNLLIISHSRSGGTEQQVQAAIRGYEAEGYSVFRLRADFDSRRRAAFFHARSSLFPNLDGIDLSRDADSFLSRLYELGISEIEVHHLADFGQAGAEGLAAILHKSGLPYRYVVHDYLSICPRISLSDENGRYCGEPDEAGCKRCLVARRSEFGAPNITEWRKTHHGLLAGAEAIIVPDGDVAERLNRYWPELDISVVPHDQPVPGRHARPGLPRQSDILRVGALGAISAIKGFSVLTECAEASRNARLPLAFSVVGFTSDDPAAQEAGITVTGAYTNDQVHDYIERAQLDVIFLPSIWPETYSFTLSIAIESGLPIVAFDIGAIAARLRRSTGVAYRLLPLGISASDINDALLQFNASVKAGRAAPDARTGSVH